MFVILCLSFAQFGRKEGTILRALGLSSLTLQKPGQLSKDKQFYTSPPTVCMSQEITMWELVRKAQFPHTNSIENRECVTENEVSIRLCEYK
jgi:hypothetical protein